MKTCSSYSHRFSLFRQISRKVCSREKTDVRQSDVRPEACGASFQTKKTGTRAEVRGRRGYGTVIPSDSHSEVYFPPFVETNGFETTDCLECLQILDVLYMAGGRNNKGLLLRDTSHLFPKFIEFP